MIQRKATRRVAAGFALAALLAAPLCAWAQGIAPKSIDVKFPELTMPSETDGPGLVPSVMAYLGDYAGSAPPEKSVPAQQVVAPSALPALGATALPLTNNRPAPRVRSERAELERLLVKGGPARLAQAAAAIDASTTLKSEDATFLRAVIAGMRAILYPPAGEGAAAGAAAVQANIRPGDAIILSQLAAASAGNPIAPTIGNEGNPLAEMIPILAIFKSTNRETAETCLEAADRVEGLGLDSAITGLARALDMERTGAYADAEAAYNILLAGDPDLWPARFGLGRCLLARGKCSDALETLGRIAEARSGAHDFTRSWTLALYHCGRFEEASPLAAKVLAREPFDAAFVLMRAHMLAYSGDFSGAQVLLDQYARFSPADPLFMALAVQASLGLKREGEAILRARKAAAAYPADPVVIVQAAAALSTGSAGERAEAVALCRKALDLVDADGTGMGMGTEPTLLQAFMREQARNDAVRILVAEASGRQDWYAAASWLDRYSTVKVDRGVVSSILRRSGRVREAVKYTKAWYDEVPGSEAAAEAYLRSLAAAAGGATASAADPAVSDALPGMGSLFGALLGAAGGAESSDRVALVDFVLQLLGESWSSSLRSFLFYIQGSIQGSDTTALASYRAALLEKADNVEALVGSAEILLRQGNQERAAFYFRQARALGSTDPDIAERIAALSAALSGFLTASLPVSPKQ